MIGPYVEGVYPMITVRQETKTVHVEAETLPGGRARVWVSGIFEDRPNSTTIYISTLEEAEAVAQVILRVVETYREERKAWPDATQGGTR